MLVCSKYAISGSSRCDGWILRVRELSVRVSRAPYAIWDPISGRVKLLPGIKRLKKNLKSWTHLECRNVWNSIFLSTKMLHLTDGVIQNHWKSVGFIKILKSWTHLGCRHAWNAIGFSTKMLRDTNGILQKYWNSLRFIYIFKAWNNNC